MNTSNTNTVLSFDSNENIGATMRGTANPEQVLLTAIQAATEGDVDTIDQMLNAIEAGDDVANALANLLCLAEMVQESDEEEENLPEIPDDLNSLLDDELAELAVAHYGDDAEHWDRCVQISALRGEETPDPSPCCISYAHGGSVYGIDMDGNIYQELADGSWYEIDEDDEEQAPDEVYDFLMEKLTDKVAESEE